jgi:DUF971 family protein
MTEPNQATAWPSELVVRNQGRELFISFESGDSFTISAELLRVESPSAEVKGHGPGQEVLVRHKSDVTIKKVEPVGTYAVRLIFSDSHSTGIFTWTYLHKLGRDGERLMQEYREKCSNSLNLEQLSLRK